MAEFTLDSLIDSISDAPVKAPLEKVATEVSVADELKDTLTKEASASTSIGDTNMSVETGNAIADSILAMLGDGMDKQAAHGEAGGNKVKADLDEMEAQHDERVTLTPREGRTVTEVAKALLAKAPAGAGCDEVDGATEGNAEASVSAVPSDIEKSASIAELTAEGYSFDDAVELVKQASAEIENEVQEFEKVAAVNALVQEGLSIDDALEKVASHFEEASEYSELEKMAAVNQLMAEDGISMTEAYAMVKEAALAGK